MALRSDIFEDHDDFDALDDSTIPVTSTTSMTWTSSVGRRSGDLDDFDGLDDPTMILRP